MQKYQLSVSEMLVMDTKVLKIVHVNDVASVGSNLVSGLCKIGINAKLYRLLNLGGKKYPKFLQLGISAILRVSEIFRFKQYIKKEEVNIIHIHYGTHAYLPLLFRVPFFLHIHGSDVRLHIHWPILGKIIRTGIEKAETVFYSTPDLKPLVEAIRPDAIFFPNPIDTEHFIPRVSNDPQNDPVIFNINKMDRFKGIEEILRSIELIWERYPKTTVKMFNFGNAMKDAQGFLKRHEGDSRLILLPPVPHEEMISLIQGSTLIIGQLETRALTVSELEAMACCKPVICCVRHSADYPTPPPILNATTAEDIRDFANSLLKNPNQGTKLGMEARNWVVENLDTRVVAKKLMDVYYTHSTK